MNAADRPRPRLEPALEAYIEANRERYLAAVADLCRLPSISAQNTALPETAQAVADLMHRWGLPAEVVQTDDAPAVYAEIPGRSPRTILLYNHYDVQPPDPLDEWLSPPFEPTIRDGRLHARGVADDKGDLVSRLAAVEALLKVRGELPIGVKFLFEGQEEIDGVAIQDYIRRNPEQLACDVAFVEASELDPSGRPMLVLGTKGMLYVELEARGPAIDVHSSLAAAVPNPAWQLVWALSAIVDADGGILIPGFFDDIRPLTATERANIAALPDPTTSWRESFELTSFPGGLEGSALLERVLGEPTATICGLWSGYSGAGLKTILPAVARAKLDFRLVPNQRPADILAKLRAHLDAQGFADIRITVHTQDGIPARTPSDDPWVQRVAAISSDWYGKPTGVQPNSAGGVVMEPFITALGAPTMFGGVRPPGGRYHAPNEYIEVDEFTPAVQFFAYLLDRLGADDPAGA
jgi:acetylornithine deacetylase/succinyl-diaminopimelate desuccinylase-like protein